MPITSISLLVLVLSSFIVADPAHPYVYVWMNGGNNTGTELYAQIFIEPFKKSGDWQSFLHTIEDVLPPVRQNCVLEPFGDTTRCIGLRIYNWQRKGIYLTEDLKHGDLLYVVMPDESFIWPGLYIGHKVTVHLPEKATPSSPLRIKRYTLETVSLVPRAFAVEDFLENDEIDKIIELGKQTLQHSTIDVEEKATVASEARKSMTAWLTPEMDPLVKRASDRASRLTHTPVPHQEGLQVLHYNTGGYYRSHCDYFGNNECDLRPAVRNRFITMVFYLNQPIEGGGTNFNRVKMPADTDDEWQRRTEDVSCKVGLTVQPKKAKAFIFYNLHPQTYRSAPYAERTSEHTACNVTKGEKWAANFWIWNNYRFAQNEPGGGDTRLKPDSILYSKMEKELVDTQLAVDEMHWTGRADYTDPEQYAQDYTQHLQQV